MQRIIDGRLFDYVQCDIELPEHLRNYFSNFPPMFKKTVVSRDHIGNLMKQYAGKDNIMVQPRRMLISSFILTNGTIITPLLLFYLKLGLVCIKDHRFVQYTPRNCFENFVKSTVDARRQRDENPKSSNAAETMKLLANSCYGCQIKDRSRHTVTKYLTDEKTHSAFKSEMFKQLNHIIDQLFEVELVKLRNWAQRTNHCGVLYLAIRKNQNVGTSLQILQKILWHWQVWRTWNGYRLPLLSLVRRKLGKCYSSPKTSWMGPVTF